MDDQGISNIVRQLAAVLQNLAETRQNSINDPARGMFKMVVQNNLPLYQGESDPNVLENWLRKFDKLVVVVNCPGNLRVNNVVYYLMGETDLWWQRCENALRATPGFGWESFKDALKTKFYQPYLKKQKAQEYIELKMDGMVVTEYYSKL